jgi:hypothetical protein
MMAKVQGAAPGRFNDIAFSVVLHAQPDIV